MKWRIILIISTLIINYIKSNTTQCNSDNKNCISFSKGEDKFFLVIHSGAEPTYTKKHLNYNIEKNLKKGMFEALKSGYLILRKNYENNKSDKSNKSYLEAIQKSISIMEDNEIFNAGRGGKITENMEVECDASIMDGADLSCGAVAGVKTVKNPILLANIVKDKTKHIFFHSTAAEKLAEKYGLEIVNNEYFFTTATMDEFIDFQDKVYYGTEIKYDIEQSNGTVGAVVLDHLGNLAAGTSTGGPTYKMSGRIGDSPIIGSATYANNLSVAVSCTGVGEEMIKRSAAFDVHARYSYKNLDLKQVASEFISQLKDKTGGFISIDKNGVIEMPFNTDGMGRGYVDIDGNAYIAILKENDDITPVYYNVLEDFESHFK